MNHLSHRPYPYPVKPLLLALLGLRVDASEAQYHLAWDAALKRELGGKTPKQEFTDRVHSLTRVGIDYTEAFKRIIADFPELAKAAWPGWIERQKADAAPRPALVKPSSKTKNYKKRK
jgi:hypothetical protein